MVSGLVFLLFGYHNDARYNKFPRIVHLFVLIELAVPHYTVRLKIYRKPRYTATNCGEETMILYRGFGCMYLFLRVFSVAQTVGQLG